MKSLNGKVSRNIVIKTNICGNILRITPMNVSNSQRRHKTNNSLHQWPATKQEAAALDKGKSYPNIFIFHSITSIAKLASYFLENQMCHH